jgi:predicted Ser/Thr protein kinase
MPTTEREHDSAGREDADTPHEAVVPPSRRFPTAELEHLVDAVISEREPIAPPVPDPYLGVEVDRRYVIESLIAAGGMGLVYRGRHSILGKKLAIKIIRADVAQMPDGSERFLLEAKAASAIGNEHIVDIGDYGSMPDGSPYLVMEYLDGVSLATLLKEEPYLGVPRIARIACQIAEGLGAAHAVGIVHRDLKPDNVFVLERKEGDFVKILDFGVARMAQNAKKLTQAGTIVGTPHYMSPEQALGHEVDHRGDIYALGVMLYELLTGRVPFDGSHYVSVLHQHLQAPPPPFISLDPPVYCPEELEQIVARCLAKAPEDRYATMEDLAIELGRFRDLELTLDAGLPEKRRGAALARTSGSATHTVTLMGGVPVRAPMPMPYEPLVARDPTLVMPRLTGRFGVPRQRLFAGVSVFVLLVVCVAAAFRLGTSEGRKTRAGEEPAAPSEDVRTPRATPPRVATGSNTTAVPSAPVTESPPHVEPPPSVAAASADGAGGQPPASGEGKAPAQTRQSHRATPQTPARGAASRRAERVRPSPAPKQRAKEDFMNPWPAPR